MKSVLFVYVPFCSPASPPYSLTYLAEFVRRNSDASTLSVEVLDLNAVAHRRAFPSLYEEVLGSLNKGDLAAYAQAAPRVKLLFGQFAKEENLLLRHEQHSALLEFCVQEVVNNTPDVVCLSVVYNSQSFFAHALTKRLQEKGIRVLVGGPAASQQLRRLAIYLPHEVALLQELQESPVEMDALDARRIVNYSLLSKEQYFTSELVIPLKTTSCCYYQQCAFCTHHLNGTYVEYDLEDIKESIVLSQATYVFFIDDMIHKHRLLSMAKMLAPLRVEWMCQLRPTKEFDEQVMKTLYDSGLRQVIWGVESGNDRVLAKMKKGTNVLDVEGVLAASKAAGITNVTYIMFGFPTETKEEFLDTIEFLKRNKHCIDLVSTSVFGFQEDAPLALDPESFGIVQVQATPRDVLPDSLEYTVKEGLHSSQARVLRQKFARTISSINKFPKEMNMYREHLLLMVDSSHR